MKIIDVIPTVFMCVGALLMFIAAIISEGLRWFYITLGTLMVILLIIDTYHSWKRSKCQKKYKEDVEREP